MADGRRSSLCEDLTHVDTLHVLLRRRNYVSYVTYEVRHFHATG